MAAQVKDDTSKLEQAKQDDEKLLQSVPERTRLDLRRDENDEDGFLSDILSALCEDDIEFRMYHEKEYWNRAGNKEMEIFANLFSLECFRDEEKLKFLRKYFPEVVQAYDNMRP